MRNLLRLALRQKCLHSLDIFWTSALVNIADMLEPIFFDNQGSRPTEGPAVFKRVAIVNKTFNQPGMFLDKAFGRPRNFPSTSISSNENTRPFQFLLDALCRIAQ